VHLCTQFVFSEQNLVSFDTMLSSTFFIDVNVFLMPVWSNLHFVPKKSVSCVTLFSYSFLSFLTDATSHPF
jgi:hypothetical protein